MPSQYILLGFLQKQDKIQLSLINWISKRFCNCVGIFQFLGADWWIYPLCLEKQIRKFSELPCSLYKVTHIHISKWISYSWQYLYCWTKRSLHCLLCCSLGLILNLLAKYTQSARFRFNRKLSISETLNTNSNSWQNMSSSKVRSSVRNHVSDICSSLV